MMDKRTQTDLLLDCYGALLTDKQCAIMRMHLDEDFSLAEIAEREGISRQAVRDTIMRAQTQLDEYEAKLGFMKRDLELARDIRVMMEDETKTTGAQRQKKLERMLERIEGDNGV